MTLKSSIEEFAKEWQNYRDFTLAESKSGASIRIVKQDHKVYDLLNSVIKSQIENIVNSERYLVTASLGQGNVSAIPWIAILDKSITTSPSEQFYIVVLFSRSARKIYLTLGLGSLQFEKLYGNNKETLETIKLTTKKFREMFSEYIPRNSINKIDLLEDNYEGEKKLTSTSRWLVESYEFGTCFGKSYLSKEFDEGAISRDIAEFLNIYQNIVKDPQSASIDILSEKYSENITNINLSYELTNFVPRKGKLKKQKTNTNSSNKSQRRSQESRKVGLSGEDHVYEYEYNRLTKSGHSDLADKIRKHCELGETPGWDITSFNEDGTEKFIEVKSTKGKTINDFDFTPNEWRAASEERNKYYVYLVIRALSNDRKIIEVINNPYKKVEDGQIKIETSQYNLDLRTL